MSDPSEIVTFCKTGFAYLGDKIIGNLEKWDNIDNHDNNIHTYKKKKFLFTLWRDKPNGKGKEEIPWGISTE